ncbi:galactose oxidase [Gigaspora margarita]|uniref:Galactose oxidase n=1 Tax=Gigaspora margarita TaxID=4874 RepID=A0A8H3X9C9_GIGMA|nr:galactose oxidase [Gigaspora margarita]
MISIFFCHNEPAKSPCSVNFLVSCQNVPKARYKQTSALVGTKLYFFGGETSFYVATNEVWYLDLSKYFNTILPPWHEVIGMPVGYAYGSACVSPIDNYTVFLVGGRTSLPNTTNYILSSSVYAFNTKTSQWSTPSINNFNSSFARRNEMQAVVDGKGRIYSFGGTDYDNSTTPTTYNDMNILDITTMTWSTQIQSQSLAYIDYAATLLPNGLIIYIGGREVSALSGSFVNMTQDGNIILYGGASLNISGAPVTIFSDLAVLNTNTWVWSIPSTSGTKPPPLMSHSAALYKNYMIIAFGQNATEVYSKNIYILDTRNYSWVISVI